MCKARGTRCGNSSSSSSSSEEPAVDIQYTAQRRRLSLQTFLISVHCCAYYIKQEHNSMQQLHSSACNPSEGRGMLPQLGRCCGGYWNFRCSTLLRRGACFWQRCPWTVCGAGDAAACRCVAQSWRLKSYQHACIMRATVLLA
jgi:hypothetical protein